MFFLGSLRGVRRGYRLLFLFLSKYKTAKDVTLAVGQLTVNWSSLSAFFPRQKYGGACPLHPFHASFCPKCTRKSEEFFIGEMPGMLWAVMHTVCHCLQARAFPLFFFFFSLRSFSLSFWPQSERLSLESFSDGPNLKMLFAAKTDHCSKHMEPLILRCRQNLPHYASFRFALLSRHPLGSFTPFFCVWCPSLKLYCTTTHPIFAVGFPIP